MMPVMAWPDADQIRDQIFDQVGALMDGWQGWDTVTCTYAWPASVPAPVWGFAPVTHMEVELNAQSASHAYWRVLVRFVLQGEPGGSYHMPWLVVVGPHRTIRPHSPAPEMMALLLPVVCQVIRALQQGEKTLEALPVT